MQVAIQNRTLSRDMNSRALIETDLSKVNEYKLKTKLFNDSKELKEQICALMKRVTELENVKTDILEIKELLRGLIK